MISLSVFLLLSYLPLYESSIGNFTQKEVTNYQPESPLTSSEVGASVSFYETVNIGFSIRTLQYPAPKYPTRFCPIESTYKFNLSVTQDPFELGLNYECTHPTMSNFTPKRNYYASSLTEVYIKTSYKTTIKE